MKHGVQDEGGRHVAKGSSDSRVAYSEVKVQVRDLVRVVGNVAVFAQRGVLIRGKSFFRAPGGKWVQKRSTTEEPGKVHNRKRVGIVKGSSGYRAVGQDRVGIVEGS